ncbi:hypothetical protein NCCP1664_14330 [Zafaria cholistanensis]|uniref:Uncharacterized protein n=1 Tax=Zafaria cholistanensis TaxID=1682741 RepID=A0A5A7NSR2_9MICC|nr:hypothetical protein NCCP1664_14330 [Zafaria cholistanensis]
MYPTAWQDKAAAKKTTSRPPALRYTTDQPARAGSHMVSRPSIRSMKTSKGPVDGKMTTAAYMPATAIRIPGSNHWLETSLAGRRGSVAP